MKIKKVQEFNAMRKQSKITEKPILNECVSVANGKKGELQKNGETTKSSGAIILPNCIPNKAEIISSISTIINQYVVEHSLTIGDIVCEIDNLLCGEYDSNGVVFDEKSLCVFVYDSLAESKCLKEIAIMIMTAFDLSQILIFCENEKVEICRIDDVFSNSQIKRFEDFRR